MCGGQAITVVTVGASRTGTAATSSRRWVRQDSGALQQARPSAISWSSCAWSRAWGPGRASVTEAARLVEDTAGALDVLVDNAGITGGVRRLPTTVDPETLRTVVETNVIGVIRVTDAMPALPRRSPAPRIVTMPSGVGSLTRQTTSAATQARSFRPPGVS